MRDSEGLRKGFVLTLLICAVLVRFLLSWRVSGTQTSEQNAVDLRPRVTEPAQPAAELLPEEPEAPAEIRLPTDDWAAPEFTPEDAAGITVGGACSYPVSVSDALQTDWLGDGRSVLILHTHGTEAYTASPGWGYEGSSSLRSEDPDYSVVRVGRALKEALEARGVTVYHDETMYDRASFNGAYAASGAGVRAMLEAHPDVGLVIDLHRDAALNPDGSDFAATLRADGTEYARLMLVVGTDQGGLDHPNWRQNLGCAAQLQALTNRLLPGLFRDLDLRTERFNQHLCPGFILIEVGAAGNTMPQALASMPVLADAIAALLGRQ